MLMLPKDLKEAAAIERRRRYEEDRKCRIFNARKRILGYCSIDSGLGVLGLDLSGTKVDEDTLKRQIEERKLKEEEEQRLNEAFEQQRIRDAQLATLLERKIEEDKRRMNSEINTFRTVYQKPENRREFDLYDPDRLKKDIPCRLADDDPRCGLSSAQKFEGEDLSSKERLKTQVEQQRAWLEQQMAERKVAENERKSAEEAYQAALVARDKRACDLDRMEQETRRRLNEATLRFNKALTEEQESKHRLEERKELEDKRAEMFNIVTCDMLTENPETCRSNLGPQRIVGYMYRGMSPEEKEEVRRHQLKQIEEKRLEREAEARRDAEWDSLATGMARHVVLKDRELMRKQRELNKQLFQQNKLLSKEQKSHQEYVERVVFTNEPTPAYFAQFNTSTR